LPYGAVETEVLSDLAFDAFYRFTGKERDEGTGLDFFGLRCYAASIGRWISPDPAMVWIGAQADHGSDAASPADVLANTREHSVYAYARGAPVALIDENGLWSSKFALLVADDVHQMAIERVAGGRGISQNAIRVMQDAQVDIDRFQSNADQYLHAMRGSGVSKSEAITRANNWVNDRLMSAIVARDEGREDAAWQAVGLAIHTVQDATSPAHRGFQMWDSHAGFRAQIEHGLRENTYPTAGTREARELEGATRWILDVFESCRSNQCTNQITFFDEDGELALPKQYWGGPTTSAGEGAQKAGTAGANLPLTMTVRPETGQ
jgi:RHS repeat-associated protein